MQSKDDERLLRALIRSERSAITRDRYRAVLLVLEGHTAIRAAEMLGRSRKFVQVWLAQYRAEGIKGLGGTNKSGRRPKLCVEDEKRLTKMIRELQHKQGASAGGVSAKRVQQLLHDEFNVTYSISSVYVLMKRLNA